MLLYISVADIFLTLGDDYDGVLELRFRKKKNIFLKRKMSFFEHRCRF